MIDHGARCNADPCTCRPQVDAVLAMLDQIGVSLTPWQRRALMSLYANKTQLLQPAKGYYPEGMGEDPPARGWD